MAPIPAARTRIPPVRSTPSPRHQQDGKRSSSSSSDELTLDEQSLDMFSTRNELNQTAEAQRAVVARQLELQARQRAEAEHLKVVQEQQRRAKEAERKKTEEMLAREKAQLQQTMEEHKKGASPAEVVEQPKRKKWNRHPEIHVDLLAATPSESADSSGDEAAPASIRGLRAQSRASRASSVSEFFSLSEDEDDSPIQQAVAVGFREEDEDDPDASFAAMCAALARRKQTGDPALPADLSMVPVETLQSEGQVEESDRLSSWRRSSSEPGWIPEKSVDVQVTAPSQLTSPARRSSSFNDGQRRKSTDIPADPLLFPPLSNSSFSAVL